MRQELWQLIEPALEHVRRQHEAHDQRPLMPDGRPAAGRVSLLPETEQGLERMHGYMQSLKACMAAHPDVRDAYTGTAYSISINWSENRTSEEFVVEFSQWAPLATVYTYGSPPAAVSQQLDACLAQLPLMLLNDDEVHELYERELYFTLF
ncbi:MAG: hypothetical protein JOZ51_11150 [Chloroflexi bacterium]|nr:hypothetical protein [Chloroflexota bacterium]